MLEILLGRLSCDEKKWNWNYLGGKSQKKKIGILFTLKGIWNSFIQEGKRGKEWDVFIVLNRSHIIISFIALWGNFTNVNSMKICFSFWQKMGVETKMKCWLWLLSLFPQYWSMGISSHYFTRPILREKKHWSRPIKPRQQKSTNAMAAETKNNVT